MIELFTLTESMLLFSFILCTINFSIQMLYTVSAFIPRKEKIFEITLGIYFGVLSIVLRSVVNGYRVGRINSLFYDEIHFYMMSVVFIAAALTIGAERKYRVLSALLFTFMSYPLFPLPFGWFRLLFVLSLVGFFARSTYLYVFNLKWRKSNITAYTFKEAFDSQHIGVLFFDKNYNILLINQRMQELMEVVLGHGMRDAKILDERLKAQVPDQSSLIYEAPDGIIWKIVKTPIQLKKKEIHQLIATDITQQAKIISQLSEVEEQLRSQNNELLHTMKNLEEIKKQEALQKSWHYIHDKMGQQVSMIQRLLQSKRGINQEELFTLIGNLEQQFAIEEDDPLKMLCEIKQDYENLGISVHQEGDLPTGELAITFVEIIRECVTNAVRHGMAKNIWVKIVDDAQQIQLIVSNDGERTEDKIQWGNGLTGILEKTKTLGGELKIFTEEEFSVQVTINK